MSRERMIEFFSAVTCDPVLQQRLIDEAPEAIVESLVSIAQECGYNFTAEDYNAFIAEENVDKLSDETLTTWKRLRDQILLPSFQSR